MTIELRPDLEQRIRELIGVSAPAEVGKFVEELLESHLNAKNDDLDFEELDVTEAIAQLERGEGIPAEQVIAELRARHGIQG